MLICVFACGMDDRKRERSKTSLKNKKRISIDMKWDLEQRFELS